MTDTDLKTAPDTESILAQISRSIAQVYARFYGRGPEKARTTWQRGHLVCVLEDIYTPGEQTLIENGKFENVREMRVVFQDQVEPLLREAVEAITGRKVRAFFSQVSADPQMAAEVFVLENADAEPARA